MDDHGSHLSQSCVEVLYCAVLCCAVLQAMVKAGGQLVDEHGPLLTEVLREAYVAVVRDGVLMAGQDPANLDVEASSEGGFCRSSLTAQ